MCLRLSTVAKNQATWLYQCSDQGLFALACYATLNNAHQVRLDQAIAGPLGKNMVVYVTVV